jgi:hypothetical protein
VPRQSHPAILMTLIEVFGTGVAQSVYCVVTDWTTGVRSPAVAKDDFSSSRRVQTASGAHPASCRMGTGGSFPSRKARPGRDAHHSHLVPRS